MENDTTNSANTSDFKQAKQELDAVCAKYDIVLVPVVVHEGSRTFSSIQVVPRSNFQAQQNEEGQQA